MDFNTLKILIVEDDFTTRSTLRAMLAELGVNQIFDAKNGQEAIDFVEIEAAEINLVVSDWNMPQKSGLDLLNVV